MKRTCYPCLSFLYHMTLTQKHANGDDSDGVMGSIHANLHHFSRKFQQQSSTPLYVVGLLHIHKYKKINKDKKHIYLQIFETLVESFTT